MFVYKYVLLFVYKVAKPGNVFNKFRFSSVRINNSNTNAG